MVRKKANVDSDSKVFSLKDVEYAIEDALKDMFGCDLVQIVAKAVNESMLQYTNLHRFQWHNCPGCVSGFDECGVLRVFTCEYDEAWDKICDGEITVCPIRTNSTFGLSPEGPRKIDLRGEKPYPIIPMRDDIEEVKDENSEKN